MRSSRSRDRVHSLFSSMSCATDFVDLLGAFGIFGGIATFVHWGYNFSLNPTTPKMINNMQFIFGMTKKLIK